MSQDACESTPVSVPRNAGAKQAGEVRVRWAWTERTVWTDRMLTALEQGVKGGVWFSLIERWPNAFFAAQELFSMETAHVRLRQSARR